MSTLILQPAEPRRRPGHPPRFALWELGFRPFYLLAALLALLSVPLWALQFGGWLQHAWLRGPLWHAHEMLFGYTLAVVVGFLYTAGRNWSGQATPRGAALAALAALWLAARVLVLTPWGVAAALANVAFPFAAAWGLWRALRRGGNRRNHFFVALLVLLALAAAVFHLAQLGVQGLPLPGRTAITVGLDVVVFMVAVMGGRVIPGFSNNGVPGMTATRQPRLEQAALGGVLALLAADVLQWQGAGLAALLVVLLLLHATRLALWQPWKTLGTPLVWVLHAAYAWLPVHLGLRAAAELGWIAPGPAVHALTLGVIATITLGMITRTALGHTGRPLRASAVETAAFLAIQAAALTRVLPPLVEPAWLLAAVHVSSTCWTLAYALYLARYLPMLVRPRIDALPG
ncbi:MAG: hypothetical protein RLZZ584_1951 [Pseudomonadota bacterium]